MRLLVLAALAAVTVADVSHLPSYEYGPPASSYGVPQSSVTDKYFLNAVTPPQFGLNLPILEHQDFNSRIGLSNPGFIFGSTPAPFVDSGFPVSTPAPSLDLGVVSSTTPAPSVDLGVVSSTTPAPLVPVRTGIVSSTPAPSVSVTSGSQENLNLNFNPGYNFFSTPAPTVFSTPAPSIFSTPVPTFNSGLNFPNFNLGYSGLGGFSTPAPITFGSGGLAALSPNVFSADAALNSANIHAFTSGGSLNDAFGVSTSGQSQPAKIYKHVYFYAAPEEPELPRPRINVISPAPAKKNVKIIFIKSPAPPPPAPIRIAAPPPDEEKTVVYVLVRKPEERQDIELQAPPPAPPSRPEVYFIKYKTQQEAEQAISQVQGGHASSDQHVVADTVSGGDVISSISKETSIGVQPVVNYVTSTPAPIDLVNVRNSFNAQPIFNYVSTTTPAPIDLVNVRNSFDAQPIFNYVSTTTPAPIFNSFGIQSGGLSDLGYAPNYNLAPQIDNLDISQNLISPSLVSTESPLTVSTGASGLIGHTTPVPHVTYGPPGYKK